AKISSESVKRGAFPFAAFYTEQHFDIVAADRFLVAKQTIQQNTLIIVSGLGQPGVGISLHPLHKYRIAVLVVGFMIPGIEAPGSLPQFSEQEGFVYAGI